MAICIYTISSQSKILLKKQASWYDEVAMNYPENFSGIDDLIYDSTDPAKGNVHYEKQNMSYEMYEIDRNVHQGVPYDMSICNVEFHVNGVK